MALRRCLSVVMLAALAAGCASTIAPEYKADKPDIMRIGDRPQEAAAVKEQAGSFCVEIAEKWHDDGKTPDGRTLWAKDTVRKVIPCSQ